VINLGASDVPEGGGTPGILYAVCAGNISGVTCAEPVSTFQPQAEIKTQPVPVDMLRRGLPAGVAKDRPNVQLMK
jgi:hypothetical protein